MINLIITKNKIFSLTNGKKNVQYDPGGTDFKLETGYLNDTNSQFLTLALSYYVLSFSVLSPSLSCHK